MLWQKWEIYICCFGCFTTELAASSLVSNDQAKRLAELWKLKHPLVGVAEDESVLPNIALSTALEFWISFTRFCAFSQHIVKIPLMNKLRTHRTEWAQVQYSTRTRPGINTFIFSFEMQWMVATPTCISDKVHLNNAVFPLFTAIVEPSKGNNYYYDHHHHQGVRQPPCVLQPSNICDFAASDVVAKSRNLRPALVSGSERSVRFPW